MKTDKILKLCLAASMLCFVVSSRASAAQLIVSDATRVSAVVPDYTQTKRPSASERLFQSSAVESEIARIKGVLTNRKLAWMFENCFPNTLDTTVRYRTDDNGKDDTVVYTGRHPCDVAPGLRGPGVALPATGP